MPFTKPIKIPKHPLISGNFNHKMNRTTIKLSRLLSNYEQLPTVNLFLMSLK